MLLLTDLSHYFIVLKHPPSNVDAIVIPICPWHLLVDIGIDSCHAAGSLNRLLQQFPTRTTFGVMVKLYLIVLSYCCK